MNYLLIENKGILDINALILMGGTTKRDDDSKIGFFGSGNKYAIALLVKNNIDFKIFAGDSEIEITTRPVQFRDKSFEQILVNGQETSLTTDMGPQWQMWQAVREFVSNAIDEGNYNIITFATHIESRPGYTRIYLPHIPEVEEVIKQWDCYFAFDRTDELLNVKGNKIYPQADSEENLILFRKDIRCYYNERKSLFQYNLTDFYINESRIIENIGNAESLVCKFLAEYATIDIAYEILKNSYNEKYWESIFWWYYNCDKLNDHWRTAIGNKIIIVDEVSGWYTQERAAHPHFIVKPQLAKEIARSFPDVTIYGLRDTDERGAFRKRSPGPKAAFMLQKAQEFFNETEYEVLYPIETGEFDKDNQLGGIGIDEIHIANKVFDMGMKELIMTIMEENEHLKTKYKDCTREFQNHWIRLFLTEKEERFAYFL